MWLLVAVLTPMQLLNELALQAFVTTILVFAGAAVAAAAATAASATVAVVAGAAAAAVAAADASCFCRYWCCSIAQLSVV